MGSLIISIIAFYVVLSLSNQDVMRYLQSLESDAIRKLFSLIGVLYGFTLFIIFALIYFASKYQIERRSHEFGVYLMMGMKRTKLLLMLLLEDVGSSVVSLLIGLPVSLLITEVVSLLTVKVVGIGFLGHQTTFSLNAALITAAGFIGVKFLAFLIHAFKLSCKEVGTLLSDAPENVRKRGNSILHVILLLAGMVSLIWAYKQGIHGDAWENAKRLGKTVFFGILGTILLFRGLRVLIDRIARWGKGKKLHVFQFRQVEDTVIFKSGTLAICSLLILVAVACLSSGLGTYFSYNLYDAKRIDYTLTHTFDGGEEDLMETLKTLGLAEEFSYLGYLRIGHPYIVDSDHFDEAFDASGFTELQDELDPDFSEHYSGFSMSGFPFMIRLSDLNAQLVALGYEPVELKENELGLYRSEDFAGSSDLDNEVLAMHPRVTLVGKEYVMTGKMQSAPVVTDRFITLSGALIVPDEDYDRLTDGKTEIYLNGILDHDKYSRSNMVEAYTRINEKLDQCGLDYESYLQNMGRQLFYLVGASYITIYLALIFLVVANTILGVQFLMGQKRSSRRYRTLVKLGADHATLYKTSKKIVNWYFGLPIAVAGMSAFFATRALFNAILSSRTKTSIDQMIPVVLIVIVVFCLVECVYMHIVKRSSYRFLATLMTPEREE